MNEILYHGTQTLCIYSIMMQGFRLDNEIWGRGLGNGVYLTDNKEFASEWGPMIVRCQLKKGCRILWHSKYDRSVVSYLKREFGKDIVKPDFWKVLPKNKQLKKHEIIALWNYLVDRHYMSKCKRKFDKGLFYKFEKNYSRIYEHLKRHQFDGIGFREKKWPEVLILNPSLVTPLSAHWWFIDDISDSLSLSELKVIQEVAEQKWHREQREFEQLMREYNHEYNNDKA